MPFILISKDLKEGYPNIFAAIKERFKYVEQVEYPDPNIHKFELHDPTLSQEDVQVVLTIGINTEGKLTIFDVEEI